MAEPVNDNPTPKKTRAIKSADVHFRCEPTIKQQLEALADAHKMSLSDYLITCGLQKPLPPALLQGEDRQQLSKTLAELGKIGSNLNQLAKATNSGQAVWDAAVIRASQAVEDSADTIRRILTNAKTRKQ